MSTVTTRARHGPAEDRARRLRRRAWWSLAFLPLSFVTGVLLGGFLLAAQGYETGDELAPILQTALAGVPALIVIVSPAVLAAWLGVRARRQGDPQGGLPAVLGTLFAVLFVLQNVGSYVLGRLLD